jgi:hypothetical protein
MSKNLKRAKMPKRDKRLKVIKGKKKGKGHYFMHWQ